MNKPPFLTRLFLTITQHPKLVVGLGMAFLLIAFSAIPKLVQDIRSDAFLSSDNPALLYRTKLKKQFGLSDPVIVAIRNTSAHGIYTPETLHLIQELTDQLSALPNIDYARTVSLATEKNISSTDGDINIQGFLDPLPATQAEADIIRSAVDDFPLYRGTLVAADHSISLIIVELIDELQQESSFREVMAIVNAVSHGPSSEIHVAGEGALAGSLGSYIEQDAIRLNPLAWLIISLTIYLAFRSWHAVTMSNVIILASVIITLSAMAASNVPFFMITSALPVILIGISVADAIHIYSHYFDVTARNPSESREARVVQTMLEMWRPVTLTTLTTMAGFMGLYFAADMPPFKFFGLFAALGVFVAWLYSMTLLPASIMLVAPGDNRQSVTAGTRWSSQLFSRIASGMGLITLRHPHSILVCFTISCVAGAYSAAKLTVDENPINIFHSDEPLFIADHLINEHMAGSNALDVVIETPHKEGLFSPEVLTKIEQLQVYAATLPRVGGSTSIVDYLKQMNRALTTGTADNYKLPDDKETVAQYFLVYSAMSDPTDFEEEIDYNYQSANLRIFLNSGYYSDFKPVVEKLLDYINAEFNDETVTATLSGRVTLNYHWIKNLGHSHFAGTVMALILVGLIAAVVFRSITGGLYALLPVAISVLLVYGVMAATGLTIGVGTSMFAAVAIGLGVDFAIHTLDRLRALYQQYGSDTERVFQEFFRTTGQTLIINFLAIGCGFGVLISSKVASLNQFGGILVVAISTSFLASLTVVPALVKLLQPAFIVIPGASRPAQHSSSSLAPLLLGGLLALMVVTTLPAMAETGDEMSATEIVAMVNAVPDGEYVTQTLAMDTTDRHGQTRSQETVNYRKYFDRDKKTVLFFLQPSNVRGTGFLIWNYADVAKPDDQWLYLPALRKVRRVSAADRGDYFLGTDFTYEDMKLDGKFAAEDYIFARLDDEVLDDVNTFKLESTPKDENTARELGYSRTISWIDPSNWMLVKAEFYDLKGTLLKTLVAGDISQVDGYWTKHKLIMENHQTGHSTDFTFSNVDYVTPVEDNLFSQQALARGR